MEHRRSARSEEDGLPLEHMQATESDLRVSRKASRRRRLYRET